MDNPGRIVPKKRNSPADNKFKQTVSKEMREKMFATWCETGSYAAVARLFGYTPETVRKWSRRDGWSKRKELIDKGSEAVTNRRVLSKMERDNKLLTLLDDRLITLQKVVHKPPHPSRVVDELATIAKTVNLITGEATERLEMDIASEKDPDKLARIAAGLLEQLDLTDDQRRHMVGVIAGSPRGQVAAVAESRPVDSIPPTPGRSHREGEGPPSPPGSESDQLTNADFPDYLRGAGESSLTQSGDDIMVDAEDDIEPGGPRDFGNSGGSKEC